MLSSAVKLLEFRVRDLALAKTFKLKLYAQGIHVNMECTNAQTPQFVHPRQMEWTTPVLAGVFRTQRLEMEENVMAKRNPTETATMGQVGTKESPRTEAESKRQLLASNVFTGTSRNGGMRALKSKITRRIIIIAEMFGMTKRASVVSQGLEVTAQIFLRVVEFPSVPTYSTELRDNTAQLTVLHHFRMVS